MNAKITRRLFLGTSLGILAAMLVPVRAMANISDYVTVNFLKQKGAVFPYDMSEAEWRKKLGGDVAYAVLREGKNETAGTSKLVFERRKGTYACRGCGQPLFASTSKMMANDFPTFREPIDPNAIGTSADFGIVLPRTEVHCKNCGSHLGYKFMPQSDPAAGSWRYVINGTSLSFRLA